MAVLRACRPAAVPAVPGTDGQTAVVPYPIELFQPWSWVDR